MSGEERREAERSLAYTLGFAALIGVAASALVATTAVLLEARQAENRLLDRRRHVLVVSGLTSPEAALAGGEIERLFRARVRPVVVDLATGAETDADPETFDQERAARDPQRSSAVPENPARVARVPEQALVYEVRTDDGLDAVVLPFQGAGLWSTLYGFVALESDLDTVRGLTFYQHAETAGLGARIDEPGWRALWAGRSAFDEDGEVRLRVAKGPAPPGSPHEVDGIAGATLTGNGVTAALRFWLGPAGFGPYLARLREEGS